MQLGYVVFQVANIDAWEHFGREVLGLGLVESAAGSLAFRLDGHAQRILIEPGPADDLAALGLEVDDEAELEALAKKLDARPAEVSARRVRKLYVTEDPSGILVELCWGAERAPVPFSSKLVRAGFV